MTKNAFEVGDVVSWIHVNKEYQPGPYVVITLNSNPSLGVPNVKVCHLDGSPLYFRNSSGALELHQYIRSKKLRLDVFLTAAHKAIHAEKSKA